jgi:hypothetical protein
MKRLREEREEAREQLVMLEQLTTSRGWKEFVLPFMKAYKTAATERARQPQSRAIPGLRDYLDGQCAAYDDLIRHIYGLIGTRSEEVLKELDPDSVDPSQYADVELEARRF